MGATWFSSCFSLSFRGGSHAFDDLQLFIPVSFFCRRRFCASLAEGRKQRLKHASLPLMRCDDVLLFLADLFFEVFAAALECSRVSPDETRGSTSRESAANAYAALLASSCLSPAADARGSGREKTGRKSLAPDDQEAPGRETRTPGKASYFVSIEKERRNALCVC